MEELFKKISKDNNCEYKAVYEPMYTAFVMSEFTRKVIGKQIKTLSVNILYRKHLIKVEYNVSIGQSGLIKVDFEDGEHLPEFEIKNRSHYLRLLNKNLDILKVDSKDSHFNDKLIKKLHEVGLEELARNNQFEPIIKAHKIDNKIQAHSTYHLAFEEKKEALEPMIALYKWLIDTAIEK